MALWTPSNLATAASKWCYALDNSSPRVDGVTSGDITVTGGKVVAWKNHGSDAGDWAAPSGLQPAYSATGLAQGSGQPAVVFSGGQLLDAATTLSANTVSVFAVLSLVSGNNGKRAISLNKNTADFSDSQCAAILKSSSNTSGVAEIERNGYILTGTSQITSPCLVNTGFDGTNGFVAANGNSPTTSAQTGSLAPTHVMLGGYYYGNGSNPVDFWSGPISEVVVLYYVPTTAERQQIEGYLAWKWGTQGSLPANHTYKNAAPTVDTGGSSQTGAFAANENGDTAALAASSNTSATLSRLEQGDSASGAASTQTSGAFAGSEQGDNAAAAATESTTGALAGSEQPDTAVIAASQGSGAALAATEQGDTAAATASTQTSAALSTSEQGDAAAIPATGTTKGAISASESGDAASAAASTQVTGALARSEQGDAAAIAASQGSGALFNAPEQGDAAAASASTRTAGALASNEGGDTAAVAGSSGTTVNLLTGEQSDTATGTALGRVTGALAGTEQGDTIAATAAVPQQASLTASETPDAAAIGASGGMLPIAVLAGVEQSDTAAIAAIQIPRADIVLGARRNGPIVLRARRNSPIQLTARRVAS